MNTFSHKNDDNKFVLKNILHVPKIAKNLHSVSQIIIDNSIYLEFHLEFCCVKDKLMGKVLMQGKLNHGLYSFQMDMDTKLNDKTYTKLINEACQAKM